MIKSKADLEYYLECDKVALKINRKKPRIVGDLIWKYERLLRLVEYYTNCKHGNPIRLYLIWKLRRMGLKLGFSIPLNVVGPGLSLAHPGTVIINSNSKVGENCRIQTGVTLGSTNGSNKAPVVGNNVFLGDGCKIIGDISIADGVNIGANAVVVKSITEPKTSWGGVPARKLSDHSSESNIVKATDIVRRNN